MTRRSFFLQLVFLFLIIFVSTPLVAQDFYIPDTISKEAQDRLIKFSYVKRDAMVYPAPSDLESWKKIQTAVDQVYAVVSKDAVETYASTIIHTQMNSISVVDIRPKDWKDNRKVLIYTHGGAYILCHAYNTYHISLPMAHDTGLRVVAVDYTLAPYAKYEQVTDEIVTVIKALVKDGYELKDIGIFGDSSGGGIAAAVTLKLRDRGIGLLGAVVLWSPWADITETGDTYFTLKNHDPVINYKNTLDISAIAYAAPEQQKNPYVSPVYGDFNKGYPPTLIQVGTKEIFLSNAVRLYQAIDIAGQIVKLDVYEGMWHVFQSNPINTPEANLARMKSVAFLKKYLKY